MGHFKDEEDVYAFVGRVFQELAEDQELSEKLQRADTTVQYRMREPQAVITCELRPGRDVRVDLGPSDLDPEVVMSLEADTANRFWLGKVQVTVALAQGEIVAKGPVAKILRLIPLVEHAFPRYREMIEQAGRTDLLEAA